jgi:peptide deformylase
MAGLALRLKIVQAGDPVLRQRARALSPEEIRSAAVQALIGHMRETMRDAPGVGLAAPQIGQSLQLAVIEDRADYQKSLPAGELAARGRSPVPFHVIVNPEILARSEETDVFHEGCLSLAGFSARVERARSVRVACLDHRGEARIIEANGWYARILQHEIDHLHGGLYIDRMDPRSFTTQANYARYRDIESG